MSPNSPSPTFSQIHISRKEWLFVILFTLILLILTSIPYAYAAQSAPPEKQFMGFILNVSDHAQYLSWYKAFQSNFLTSNRLTPESNPQLFFNLLWWTLAQIGKFTGLAYPWVYQILRWFSAFAFLLISYWFIALFFPDKFHRKVTFALLSMGSGLGWILVGLKYTLTNGDLLYPLDIYIAEGNTFLCILAYPHFLEAAAFILGVFALLFIGEQKRQLRFAVLAGVVAFLLGWQHGYDLIIVWAIPCVFGAMRWILDRQFPTYWFKAMLITGLVSLPPAIYNFLLTQLDPTWDEVLAQFANAGVYTPNLLHFFILMGLPLIMAVISAIKLLIAGWKTKFSDMHQSPAILFLLVWFFVGWALTYIPTDFQIHMINSWQVPVILLGMLGFFRWVLPWLQKIFRSVKIIKAASILLVVFCALTNLYLFAWRFYDLSRYSYPYYLHRDEVAALKWLEENSPENAVILSSLEVGQYIPGITGRRAFLAHWAQTLDFYKKREFVDHFYNTTIVSDTQLETLKMFRVNYVISNMDIPVNEFNGSSFSSVFSSENIQIFQIIYEGDGP